MRTLPKLAKEILRTSAGLRDEIHPHPFDGSDRHLFHLIYQAFRDHLKQQVLLEKETSLGVRITNLGKFSKSSDSTISRKGRIKFWLASSLSAGED